MNDSIVTKANLLRLSREQLATMVKLHRVPDWKKMVPLSQRCSTYCYQNVVGWGQRTLEAENGVLAASRKTGGMDTADLMAAINAALHAVLAEMARPILTDAEFDDLTRAAYVVLAEVVPVSAPEPARTSEEELDALLFGEEPEAPGRPSESVVGGDGVQEHEKHGHERWAHGGKPQSWWQHPGGDWVCFGCHKPVKDGVVVHLPGGGTETFRVIEAKTVITVYPDPDTVAYDIVTQAEDAELREQIEAEPEPEFDVEGVPYEKPGNPLVERFAAAAAAASDDDDLDWLQ